MHIINRITRGPAREKTCVCAMKTTVQSSVLLFLAIVALAKAKSILTTKVFVIPIKPEMFDWTADARYDQYSYMPSLKNAPDLPSWIHYTYSKRDHCGFLYGSPPRDQQNFQLEIVSLNKNTYETRYRILDMIVKEKENLTKFEVQIKIDYLNVEDMFDWNRTESLIDIFKRELWKEASDLYVTFLASATDLGARLPLKPSEAEGVVVKLGSSVAFSTELNELQTEVKPLWKLTYCPRGVKRTTVERLFRSAGFVLDWCSFRLLNVTDAHQLEENQQSVQHESARRGSSISMIGLPSSGVLERREWQWARMTKSSLPGRSYFKEIAATVFIPVLLLLLLTGFLSTALCLQHEKVMDPESERYFHELFNVFLSRKDIVRRKREPSPVEGIENNGVQMVQYGTSERETLRSLSAHPPSPSDSLLRNSRETNRGNQYVRPNPPPYISPNNFTGIRTDF
ncbi:alpha-sarcoglycan-like isoform X3 [Prorops nasuta]|uniref:alpha-sarcoglycan-like isoform X3 n=1 Tax=Prorops nasuta TaxID=863751 RepID=UPI0034CF05C6